MATSESDDFESADEELDNRSAPVKRNQSHRRRIVVDSETDDDTECTSSQVQSSYGRNSRNSNSRVRRDSASPILHEDNRSGGASPSADKKIAGEEVVAADRTSESKSAEKDKAEQTLASDVSNNSNNPESALVSTEIKDGTKKRVGGEGRREKSQRQQKQREPKSLGAKKLGSKIACEETKIPSVVATTTAAQVLAEKPKNEATVEGEESSVDERCWEDLDDILSKKKSGDKAKWESSWDNPEKPKDVEECWEGMDDEMIDMPEELKSEKKFKEVFKSDGWGDVEEDIEIPDDMTEERILPVLEKLSLAGEGQDNSGSWGWGGWGVSSLINTASAGVTTLTNHVSQGLTMLEESMGVPDPEELAKVDRDDAGDGKNDEKKPEEKEVPDVESQTQSFGFGNFISGVSSITKLVESTGNKVIAGGLDTLETIGKKTMEVLQDGDPGLKKKRAFFTQEKDKPILSQILREAKDKAETEEKTLEEKQSARKVHFESLFDDYQGLVHLEALEILSKQCDIKIQQHMISLNADELCSVQETLEEVKELCDLGEEEDEESRDTDLQERLKGACKDLGVEMTYDKLLETRDQTKSYLDTVAPEGSVPSDREIFQRAISTLAKFTAFSVERFHKTAELLLVKDRRSTVNEADALVQFTNILSCEVGVVANLFADKLNERVKHSEKPDSVNANITAIFLEAANASSYIQDAFKLLIPVLQVGAT